MTTNQDIRDLLREASGAVAFAVDGENLDYLNLGLPASPTLLVAPVTNALKTLSNDGFVTGSVDRGDMWKVVGYHLDEKTSHSLAESIIDISRIHQAVIDMGLAWRASPMDDLA